MQVIRKVSPYDQRSSLPRGYRRVTLPQRSKYQGLAGKYQQALDKANAANENRYQQILGGYDALQGRVMGELAGAGAAEQRDINRQYNSMGSDVYQRLVNRGFGNSSLTATMRMGVERERADAMGRSMERAAMARANADMQISTGKMGVMERRTDAAPDPQQLIELARLSGRAGGGGYGRMPSYGQPIGMMPGQVQNAYQMAMMRHMGSMAPGRIQMGKSASAQNRYGRARMFRAMRNQSRRTSQIGAMPPDRRGIA